MTAPATPRKRTSKTNNEAVNPVSGVPASPTAVFSEAIDPASIMQALKALTAQVATLTAENNKLKATTEPKPQGRNLVGKSFAVPAKGMSKSSKYYTYRVEDWETGFVATIVLKAEDVEASGLGKGLSLTIGK